MAGEGYREEVLNVVLAQLLSEQGIVSAPERALQWPTRGRRMPDVMVVFQGLRTVIEGKVEDHPGADTEVTQDARGQVEQGIAHIGIAVLYPAPLRHVRSLDELRAELLRVRLRVAIFSEAGEQGWTDGDLDYLGSLLRRTFDQLVEEDVVARAVEALEEGIEGFALAVAGTPAVAERSAAVLGITGTPAPNEREPEEP